MEGVAEKCSNGKGLAIASFVMSILSLTCCCCSCPLFPILGIVFGVCARSSMKRTQNFDGWGMATAGVVLGIIELVASFFWIIAAIITSIFAPVATHSPHGW